MTSPHDSPRYCEAWTTTSTMVTTLIAHGVPETVIICALLEAAAALGTGPYMQRTRKQVAEIAYHAADLLAAPMPAKTKPYNNHRKV